MSWRRGARRKDLNPQPQCTMSLTTRTSNPISSVCHITVTGRQRKRSRLSGLEPMDTIFVKHVKEGGPAQHAGLHTGDRIVSVNGEQVSGKSYAQVIALIQSSDASLKLLVVPKDEDILQMAYQNSAYNQGQLPYRGDASDIPEPPAVYTGAPPRTAAGRPKADLHPQGKPPLGLRFKSELRMVPEDETSRMRHSADSGPASLDSMLGRRRTSTGSLGSVSSGTSGSSSREHVIMPLAELAPARLPRVDDLGSPGEEAETAGSFSNPPAPKRTSSRNIVLSHYQNCSGSSDSISRSSDSSHSRRSTDSAEPCRMSKSQDVCLSSEHLDRAGQTQRLKENVRLSNEDMLASKVQEPRALGKSVTTSHLPSTTASTTSHRPPPYTRSHTTSTLVGHPPTYSSPTPLRSWHTHSDSSLGSKVPGTGSTAVTFSSPQHQRHLPRPLAASNADHNYSRPSSWSNSPTTMSLNQGDDEKDRSYGATFKFTYQDGTLDANPALSPYVDVTRVTTTPGSTTSMSLGLGRVGGSDRQINLVTERMRMFESADSVDSLSSTGSSERGGAGRASVPLQAGESRSLPHAFKGIPTMGMDSVASRVSQFEQYSDQENFSGDEKRMRKVSSESAPDRARRTSRDERWRREPYSLSERNLAQTMPPSEINKIPGTPPATINIYFKGDTGHSGQTTTLQPSPERVMGSRPYSEGSCPELTTSGSMDRRDRSPLGARDLQMSPPSSRRSHKPALRQASYLNAIHSPHNKMMTPEGLAASTASPILESSTSSVEGDTLIASSSGELSMTPTTSPAVMLRQPSTTDDREAKLVRRTSYLMATGKDRPQLSMPMETSKSDSHLQLQFSSPLPVTHSESKLIDSKPPIGKTTTTDSKDGYTKPVITKPESKLTDNKQVISNPKLPETETKIVTSKPSTVADRIKDSKTLVKPYESKAPTYKPASMRSTLSDSVLSDHKVPTTKITEKVTEKHLTAKTSFTKTSTRDSKTTVETKVLESKSTESKAIESKPLSSNRPGIKKVGLKLDLSQIPEEPPPPPSSPPPDDDELSNTSTAASTEHDLNVEHGEKGHTLQLLPPRLMEPDAHTTPTKTSNIRKLKAFFGEKTPRIMEATSDRSRVFDMPASVGDIIKEGTLNCKIAVTDGKRASDRSWKPMWVLLRRNHLYLYKDKSAASQSPSASDEQPIYIKSSIVDIAYDYTKKKHVFRLTTFNGSEYLFQAEEREVMLDWIRLIQMNNNMEEEITAEHETKVSCSYSEMVEKKTAQVEKNTRSSPQAVHKTTKKVPNKSLRSKSPAAHSPGVKQKKQTFEKDHTDSPKPKDKEIKEYTRTWKSKLLFKRGGSSSSVPTEISGTFGVPIELCPRSQINEFVPLVVEVCTTIVEERGLENQGIYRVPGNTGAVNMLQEELNKDGETVDTSSDKWLDVNVVSSLLKSFFRKLPEALITDELYESVISANRIDNPEKRMLRLKQLMHKLPEHNFETFRYLAEHLAKVSSMGNVNKMDARNLAIVFGPTLVRTTDESMITMVKDMSDQCRVVESVILHNKWFFLSWEEDHEVPVDEENPDAIPVSGMNQELLNKAECLELGDRGRDLSAKDLITSVISAANRKIKKKDKKSSESGSIDVDPPSDSASYSERNIDREIELRKIKETTTTQTITKTNSKENVTVSTSVKEGRQVTVSVQEQPETTTTRVSRDMYAAKLAFMNSRTDSEASGTTTSSSGSSNDGWGNIKLNKYPAIRAPTFTSPVTENTKPTMLRRYSEDSASDRRESDDSIRSCVSPGGLTPLVAHHMRSRERDRLALQQREMLQRQEQERRAYDKRRIEQELQKTRHELEAEDSLDMMARSMDSSQLVDFRSETLSVTSDYSTTSSGTLPFDTRLPVTPHRGNLSDYSSSASPTSLNLDRSPVSRSSTLFDESDGLSQTLGKCYSSPGNRITRDDTDLYRTPTLRSPPGFDTRKVVGRGTLTRKKRSSGSEGGEEDDPYPLPPSFSRSNSFQRSSSLDSLRDFYKGDHSFMSDDSDELMESITATLDQMRLHSESRRTGVGESLSPSGDSHSRTVGNFSNIMHKNYSEGSLTADSSFRDPSLHRLGRNEPHSTVDSSLPRSESGWGKSGVVPVLQISRDLSKKEPMAPVTKSEKTDANLSKQEQDYTHAIRKSTEKLYGSREQLLDCKDGVLHETAGSVSRSDYTKVLQRQQKAPSMSPPASRRASHDKSIRRRHTVGGIYDSEHYLALLTLNQPCRSDDRLTMWPAVHDSCPGDSRSELGWLEHSDSLQRVLHSSPSHPHERSQDSHSYPSHRRYPYTPNTDSQTELGPRPAPEGSSNANGAPHKSSLSGSGTDSLSSPVHSYGATRQRPHTLTFESSI